MNAKLQFEPHLTLARTTLPPGGEWIPQAQGWSLFSVSSGVVYWLHPRMNCELVPGSALLISERATGVLRASQLGEVSLQYFRFKPSRLTGLVTLGEQQAFERAACQESLAMRPFAPGTTIARKFQDLCAQRNGGALPIRLKLLDLLIEALGDKLWEDQNEEQTITDAKVRLIKLLNDIPAGELMELTFDELVRRVRCTPRHLSRIFHELVGMSFRQKQAQLRLVRAQELLATTQSKVVEVALESGYQSLSLFNLMFKRQFGLTPAKWRDRTRQQRVPLKLQHRLRS